MKIFKLINHKAVLALVLFLFLITGKTTGIRASSSEGAFYAQTLFKNDAPAPSGKESEEAKPSQSILDKKSVFESSSPIFEKDQDQQLKAPPNFGDGGNYNPGGQVSPNSPQLPLNDSYIFWAILIFCYVLYRIMMIIMKKKKMRSFKSSGLLLLFALFVQTAFGQSLLPSDNPTPIIPSGEQLEFRVRLTPAGTYTGSYLVAAAPAGWTIVGSNPAGTIAADGSNVRITFPTISDATTISVFMKPGCNIIDGDRVQYTYYNAGNSVLTQGSSPEISNIKYPVLVQTAPADTTVHLGSEAYREWRLQENELDAYVRGGDLTIGATALSAITGSVNDILDLHILGVEFLTKNNGWQPLAAVIAPDGKSYAYTFTSADYLKIGNNDTIFSYADGAIRIREKVRLDRCYNTAFTTISVQPKIVYNITHACTATNITSGSSTVTYDSPYPSSAFSWQSRTNPTGPDNPGKWVIKLQNTNGVAYNDIYIYIYTGSSSVWLLDALNVYFSDVNGNKDNTAPVITVQNNNPSVGYTYLRFQFTTPYKSLIAEGDDGICNDLEPSSDPVYITIDWNMDLDSKTCQCGSCTGASFFSETLYWYFYYNQSPTCASYQSYSYSTVLTPSSTQSLGFMAGEGTGVSSSNLIYDPNATPPGGTQTTLTVVDAPANVSYPNGSFLNDVTAYPETVSLILPADLKYVPEGGLKINGMAVDAADIQYDASTRTLTFVNRIGALTTTLNYTFTVEPTTAFNAADKSVKVSHTVTWGSTTYTYSCYSAPLSYLIHVPEECDYIIADSFRAERTTFGFKDETRSEKYQTLDEARAAGVQLNVFGPYDNVEFEVSAHIVAENLDDDWNADRPLYAQISYLLPQSTPYFSQGQGATLEYKRPGDADWSAPISIPANDVIQTYSASTHRLQVNILPYLKAAGVSPVKNTYFRVKILSQATANLPRTMTAVSEFQMGIYAADRYVYDCNTHSDNLFVYDYHLQYPISNLAAEVPPSMIFWQNGESNHTEIMLLKLSMENGIPPGSGSEIFTNEFRPNGIINSFIWNGSSSYIDTFVFDKIYDSEGRVFVEGVDYEITQTTYNGVTRTTVTFSSGLNAYTGEYYEAKDGFVDPVGTQSYYIFASGKSVCYNNIYAYNTTTVVQFPTSAAVTNNPVSPAGDAAPALARTVNTWSISTSSTNSDQKTGSSTFAWPLRLTNSSTWTSSANGSNYFMPNTYLFIEVQSGILENYELYRVQGGVETKIDAPFIPYTDGNPGTIGAYWIKIGNIDGEYLSAYSCKADFILRAKYPDCNVSGDIRMTAKFAVNTVDYPTDPWQGWMEYGGTYCYHDKATLALTGSFYAMDFSGTIDASVAMKTGGQYVLCDPIPMIATYVNNLYCTAGDLEFKIYRTSVSALQLGDPATTLYYKKNGVTYNYDPSWTIDNSNNEYILIKLPSSAVLDAKPQAVGAPPAGSVLDLYVSVIPTCDFMFGVPIYMDMTGTSLCGLTEIKNVSTPTAIRLYGHDDNGDPVAALSNVKLNGLDPGAVLPLLTASDTQLTLTGTFQFNTVQPGASSFAYIRLPANMRLKSNGTNSFVREGEGGPSGSSTLFTEMTQSYLRAAFAPTESNPTTYDFTVDLEVTDPTKWDCNEKIINVGATLTLSIKCHPTDPLPCEVNNSVLNVSYRFTTQKRSVEIIPDSVSLVESYDYANNRERLRLKAGIKNNDDVDVNDLVFYLYQDTDPTGYGAEDRRITAPGLPIVRSIPANSLLSFTTDLNLPAADICNLMFVMPRYGDVNQFLCDSMYVKPTLTYQLAATSFNICQGDTIVLGDPQIPGYSYQWTTSGGGVLVGADKAQVKYVFPKTANLTGNSQTQYVKLVITRNPGGTPECSTNELNLTVYVTPKRSQWIGVNTVWENPANWTQGVPAKCTYVIIPETAQYYPILTWPMTDPNAAKCDTIEFKFGGEVSKTYLLDYNAAKIRLDLNPDRWYMLSSPLRYMVTGDYYVDGTRYIDDAGSQLYDPNALKWGRTPDVYWMYYRLGNPENEFYYNQSLYWSMPFNILDQKMTPAKGLMVWADLNTNMSEDTDPTHLKSGRTTPADNKARFTFPRKENSYYYYNGIGFNDPGYTGTEVQGDRALDPTIPNNTSVRWQTTLERAGVANSDSLRSRFGYEGASDYNPSTGSFSIAASEITDYPNESTAMVGNPFMSHLNLMDFRAANNSMIGTNFYVWADNSTSFDAMKIDNMNVLYSTSTSYSIAPMQAFIVTKISPSFTRFNFNASTMSVTSPTDKLRSGNTLPTLNLGVYRSDERQSAITLVYDENADNGFEDAKDQYTLFPSETSKIILYTLADEDGQKKALSIHTFGDLSEPLPLCIRTDAKGGLLNFRLTNPEEFDTFTGIYLEDGDGVVLHNFVKDSIYTFTNYTGNIDEGRFYLRFLTGETGIDKTKGATEFYVYSSDGRVNVYSESDRIEKIEAFNLQGQSIYRKTGIGSEVYSFDMYGYKNSAIMVKVQTQSRSKLVKLMIK
ncbi:MAG: hypothetical protein FWF54_04055 [Candidatus Azobacteroides sp.]|nr:hypothetical protein [Candidatus Azobacteroides sp.]